MTILINRNRLFGESATPNLTRGVPFHPDRANCLEIAVVNNMPKAARRATERQYLHLLAAAADDMVLCVRFYSVTDLPPEEHSDSCSVDYDDISALWDGHADAAIVTGTEPKAFDFAEEPYWQSLTRTIDWCQVNVLSAIWSCLAAHAAVFHLDGIQRRPLEQKCFGIFDCELATKHPLLNDVSFPLQIQHSRWNAIDPEPLQKAGYAVLTASKKTGVDIFIKQDRCLSIFFQGHPEYERDTLLKEYRRDVARYLNHESERYPLLPEGCITDEDAAALLDFRTGAMAERNSKHISALPLHSQTGTLAPDAAAIKLYRNWLAMVAMQKAHRHARHRSGRRGIIERREITPTAENHAGH